MPRYPTLLAGISLGAAVGYAAYQALSGQRAGNFDLPVTVGHRAALVTGASSGIGEAYARALALLGYDLLIVARRKDRLEALAADLAWRHAVDVRPLVADLAVPDGIRSVARLVEAAPNLDLVVHAAGFGTVGSFAEIPISGQVDQVMLHDVAMIELASAALPGMLARGRGAIVAVSSVAAWAGLPGNVTYSASKRFLVTFCEALQSELDGSGVFAQALCPGFTVSEFHDKGDWVGSGFERKALPGFMWMSCEDVVDESLRILGNGNPVCIPGAFNKLSRLSMSILPRDPMARAARRTVRRMLRR